MIKTLVKMAIINGVVLAVLLMAIELIFGHWGAAVRGDLTGGNSRCSDPLLHHNYCPEIILTTDGVDNYINRSSVRVADREAMASTTDFAGFDVINIGDSFMQADEIRFEHTLTREMVRRTGHSALQIGDGSWAPTIYWNFIKRTPLKRGVVVNVFLFPNDFVPGYPHSSAGYRAEGRVADDGVVEFPHRAESELKREAKRILSAASVTYQLQVEARGALYRMQRIEEETVETAARFEGRIAPTPGDCSGVARLATYSETVRDYGIYAFSPECWTQAQRDGVGVAVEELKTIAARVADLGGRVNVLLIPGFFNFPFEAPNARQGETVMMAPDSSFTNTGLATYLRNALPPDIAFVNLAGLIAEAKAACGKTLTYYLPQSHWNETTHKLVGTWMSEAGFDRTAAPANAPARCDALN